LFKNLKTSRNDETPIKPQISSYTSDVSKKVISPGTELNWPSLCNKVSLSIQIETVQLNGHSTMLPVESLVDFVTKLYDKAVHLRDDNASLKEQIKNLQHPSDGLFGPPS
jgi:hypothetical protein